MYEIEVICDHCKKEFERPLGRFNEAVKFGWKQFCSAECQSKSKSKKISKICDNPVCHKSILAKKTTSYTYCSRNYSATHNNLLRLKPFVLEKCANKNCNNFLRNHECKYCSRDCVNKSKKGLSSYSKEKLIQIIQKFQLDNGRIPTKAELGYLNRPARNIFGTWNKAVKAAGFIPNKVIFSKKFTANDGHICDSLSEKIVDDWLSARSIKHEVHIRYPWKNGMSTDFKVGKYWIELFGLTGQLKKYDSLMRTKLELIKQYNPKLISLYLSDIFPVSRLNEKLNLLRK